jgi:peptidase E
LDHEIKEFVEKENFILAGYSAGAYILTPSIALCRAIRDQKHRRKYEEDFDEINDLNGLNIVNFEIFAHYSEIHHQTLLKNFRSKSKRKIREITEEGYIVLDL